MEGTVGMSGCHVWLEGLVAQNEVSICVPRLQSFPRPSQQPPLHSVRSASTQVGPATEGPTVTRLLL